MKRTRQSNSDDEREANSSSSENEQVDDTVSIRKKSKHSSTASSSSTNFASPASSSAAAKQSKPSKNRDEISSQFTSSQILGEFYKILTDAGCNIQTPIYSVENPTKFVQVIELRLARDTSLKQEFLSGLKSHINNETYFKQSLLPLEGEGYGGDSLCRLLLKVYCIQRDVLRELLSILGTINIDEDRYKNTALVENIPKLILHQFKFLDQLSYDKIDFDFKEALDKISRPFLKTDFIRLIPELVGDEQQTKMIDILSSELDKNNDFLNPLLDALSDFHFDEEKQLKTVQEVVFNSLEKCSAEEMPISLKFLVQTVSKTTMESVVEKIRQIDLNSLIQSEEILTSNLSMTQREKRSTNAIAQQESKFQSSIFMMFECIKSSLRFKKDLFKAFLKSIDKSETVSSMDVWILVIACSVKMYQSQAQKLFLKHVAEGHVNGKLFETCTKKFSTSVIAYFKQFLTLAGKCLESTNAICTCFAMEMYNNLFQVNQQNDQVKESQFELITELVSHTGSSRKREVQEALSIIYTLANKHLSIFRQYNSLFSKMIDFVEQMDDEQIRTMYGIVSSIAFTKVIGEDNNDTRLKDEILILLRKQTTSPNILYRRIAIIAVACILEHIGTISEEDKMTDTNLTEEESLRKEEYEQITELMDMSYHFASKIPALQSFYYEQMNIAFSNRRFKSTFLMELTAGFDADFGNHFLLQEIPSSYTGSQLKPATVAQMDDKGKLFVNITPFLLNRESTSYEKFLRLFPLKRLIETLRLYSKEGHLHATASLGILMMDENHLRSSFSSISMRDKDIACLSYFHAINWCRELINCLQMKLTALPTILQDSHINSSSNANGSSQNVEKKLYKLILERFDTIYTMETELDRLLFVHSTFTLPAIHYQLRYGQSTPLISSAVAATTNKKKANKKKGGENSEEEEGAKETVKKRDDLYMDDNRFFHPFVVQKLQPFFREFTLETMALLDIFESSPVSEIKGLYVLLRDLKSKFDALKAKEEGKEVHSHISLGLFSKSFKIFCSLIAERSYQLLKIAQNLIQSFNTTVDNLAAMDDEEQVDEDENQNEDTIKATKLLVPKCVQFIFDLIRGVFTYLKQSDADSVSTIVKYIGLERIELGEDFDPATDSEIVENCSQRSEEALQWIQEETSLPFDCKVSIIHYLLLLVDVCKDVKRNSEETNQQDEELKTILLNMKSTIFTTVLELVEKTVQNAYKVNQKLIADIMRQVIGLNRMNNISIAYKRMKHSLTIGREDDTSERLLQKEQQQKYAAMFKGMFDGLVDWVSSLNSTPITKCNSLMGLNKIRNIFKRIEQFEELVLLGCESSFLHIAVLRCSKVFFNSPKYNQLFPTCITAVKKMKKTPAYYHPQNTALVKSIFEKLQKVADKLEKLCGEGKAAINAAMMYVIPDIKKGISTITFETLNLSKASPDSFSVTSITQKASKKLLYKNLTKKGSDSDESNQDEPEEDDEEATKKKKKKDKKKKKSKKKADNSDEEMNDEEELESKKKKKGKEKSKKRKQSEENEDIEMSETNKKKAQKKSKSKESEDKTKKKSKAAKDVVKKEKNAETKKKKANVESKKTNGKSNSKYFENSEEENHSDTGEVESVDFSSNKKDGLMFDEEEVGESFKVPLNHHTEFSDSENDEEEEEEELSRRSRYDEEAEEASDDEDVPEEEDDGEDLRDFIASEEDD